MPQAFNVFHLFFVQNSVTHGHLMDVFEEAGFVTQEFILSPLQLGIPYSRPRYFCLVI